MGKHLLRRLVASTMLFVVGVGGGGMPALDALVFHGPSRLVESLRSHYEASSGCHADGCTIRSDVQPRVMGDNPPRAPLIVATAEVAPPPFGAPALRDTISLRYLSRAPPIVA